MHERSALGSGENRRVHFLRDRLVVGQDHATARAAQCLMGRRRRYMGMRERTRMHAAGDKTGEMRHVDHQQRIH